MKKFLIGLALAAMAILITGCSSDSGADTLGAPETNPDPPVGTAEGNADDVAPSDALGAVRINDSRSYAITELRNCEPLSDGTVERELELQGFGQHEGVRIQIDVYKQTVAGVASNDVSWSGPEGVFGSSDGATITWGSDDSHVLGSSMLVDGLNQTEKIMIDFELQVPAETVACR